MVDQAVLGRLVLCLQRAEQRLLRAQDLHRARRVLRQVDQRPGVADEARAHQLAHQHCQVGRDGVHAALEVVVQLDAVLAEAHHLVRQLLDVVQVVLADLRPHADHGRVLEVVLDLLIKYPGEVVVRRPGAITHEEHGLGVLHVVGDDLGHLGEVPAVPLAHAHDERVDVLVQRVDQRDGLDDHVVRAVHVELHLGARVTVRQAQLRLLVVAILQRLEEAREVHAAAAHDLADVVVAHARDGRLLHDGVAQLGVRHAQLELGLLGVLHLGQVHLQEVLEVLAADAVGDHVDLAQRVGRRREGLEPLQLHHLAEARHVDDGLLHSLLRLSNLIHVETLEKGVA
mmetsp:Transcript_5496/g.13902  ORF Transcript_5496/g.13902 Transcript_5496/m.13902 type:complete len:342 (+) Transcript_5496:700-1725(+)